MDERRRLNTWGQIAQYFKCDVRTVQRWTKTRNLPVRRLPGGGRASVYAYEDDLASWLDSSHKKAEPSLASVAEAAEGPRMTSRRTLLALGGIGLSAAAVTGFLILRKPRNPERAVVSGTLLTALDGLGSTLWTHRFDRPMRTADPTDPWGVRVLDLMGNGEMGVLTVCGFIGDADGGAVQAEVQYFGPEGGKPRWVCSMAPPDLLDREGKVFQNNWDCGHLITTPAENGHRIWAAFHHSWRFAGGVLKIDAHGKSKLQLAHAGHIYRLCQYGNQIAFGGVSNAVDQAAAGVFGSDDPPCASPLIGHPGYRFANAPTGSVTGYALFPTTDIATARDVPYGATRGISSMGDVLLVTVNAYAAADQYFQFSKAFEPMRVSCGGSYPLVHRKAEEDRKLDHTFEKCPFVNKPVPIRCYRPGPGWQNRDVPWAVGTLPMQPLR